LLTLLPAKGHSTDRNPLSYVSRIDDAVIHAPSHRVHALSSFDLSFFLHGRRQKIRLSLSPNHDIIADDAHIQYMSADGTVHTIEPLDRLEHRIFKGDAFLRHEGHSEWTNVGWARITVHRDGDVPIFEGAFRVDGDHHHIQTSTNYRQTRRGGDPEVQWSADEYMVVWRDSDIRRPAWEPDEMKRGLVEGESCTSDQLLYNRDDSHPVYQGLDARKAGDDFSLWSISPRALFGRQIDGTTSGNGAGVNLASTIGSTAGCPNTKKVALMGIATDCTYTAQFNSSQSVRSNIFQQINSASQLYESSFNITLGIQNLTISDGACPGTAPASAPWNVPCSNGVTITDRLNLFSKWRGQFNDSNAYWTLLSTCNTEAAVGLAWLGQACVQGSQTSSSDGANETIAGANVVVRTSQEWQVIAHETGHTFGAVHDCTPQTCSDGTVTKQQCCPLSVGTCDAGSQFIMNPSTGGGITKFSLCSIGNICSAMGRNSVKTTCLSSNRDVTTVTGSQCGNGIVEQGEDCDCGGTSGCGNNPCCNPTTCKFTANSVCDPTNEECCTERCRFLSNGTVCRQSTGICDPARVCTGNSGVCPAQATAPDGTSCGASGAGLQCASGQCTSRNLQCKTLMGSLTTGNDTYACSSSGCQLSCASPEFGPNTCFTSQQNFLDGTPCEASGRCSNGVCQGSNFASEVGSWINDNKNIVIPVVSVIGGLLLLAVLSCCVNAWRRRRRPRMMKQMPPGWGQQYPRTFGGHPVARRGGDFGFGPPPPYEPSPPRRALSTRYA
jgi:hypothetical protein